ncbi:MAG TPA: ABC transporter substrate-binding protein [Candidatus Binatia bacterium]|jgi:NitT/TauT family transport system substrate-binding protein
MAYSRSSGSLLAGLLLLSAFCSDASAEKTRIAPSSPGLSAWPIHLAAKEGFFTREGLDVEIIVMRTNVGILALTTGSVDYTTAGGSAMRAAANGAPLKMVANTNNKADLWIIGQKDLHRIEDLKGKIVGVGGNQGTQFYMAYDMLKHYGLEKDVQIVSTGDVANGFLTLQQGGLSAVALTPPYSVMAKRLGFRELARAANLLGAWPTTGLVAAREKLERNPDNVRRAVRAMLRAVRFAVGRRTDMIRFISRQYKLEPAVADEAYDAAMETLNPTLSLTDQEVQAELKRIAEQTKVKSVPRVADLVDFSFVKQAAKEIGQ